MKEEENQVRLGIRQAIRRLLGPRLLGKTENSANVARAEPVPVDKAARAATQSKSSASGA